MRKILRISLLILLFLSACIAPKKPLKPAKSSVGSAASEDFAIKSGAFGESPKIEEITASLLAEKSPTDEVVWAMSQCRCLAPVKAEILKANAVAPGALAQFLVPRVRETIRDNSQLQLLLKLPGILRDVLKSAFANDKALAGQVRSSLSSKIARVVKKEIKDDLDFRFDHYLLRGEGESFAVTDMTARWNLVLSLGAFWKNGEPLAFGHHGLQVLETARVLSEWKYIFGLDANPKGGFYGGLTFNTSEPLGQTLHKLDPREEPDASRTLSGRYKLILPEKISAVDLVVNAKEEWSRSPEAPKILEQAMMWNAGAYAFTRLRPDRRAEHTKPLYGPSDDELLPDEAHLLPLIFMSGIQGLLQEKFIDVDAREVKNLMDPTEVIDMKTLSRLGRALFSWTSVLTELETAGLTESQHEKLKTAPDRLKEALRLVILVILKDNELFERNDQPIATVAEAITLLVDTEQTLLPSEVIRDKAIQAFRQLANKRVLPAWNGTSKENLTPSDLIWFYTVASSIAKYPADRHQCPWLVDLVKKLEASLGAREDYPWRD